MVQVILVVIMEDQVELVVELLVLLVVQGQEQLIKVLMVVLDLLMVVVQTQVVVEVRDK